MKLIDGLRVVTAMWVYREPRVNDHGILLDRLAEVLAIHCGDGRAVVLRNFGFLKDTRDQSGDHGLA